MIGGVHYLITRGESRGRRKTALMTVGRLLIRYKRRVYPLIIPSGRRNKDEKVTRVSRARRSYSRSFCAESRLEHFGARGALQRRSTLLLVGRRNWVNPTSRRSPFLRGQAAAETNTTRTFVKVQRFPTRMENTRASCNPSRGNGIIPLTLFLRTCQKL